MPFLDLGRTHAPLIEELLGDVEALLESGAFVNGPAVGEFERAFARFCGADACVGMSSGLDALRIGLLAGGLAPGDEVIVPALTFVATLEAVTQAGGTPVVVDVSADDLCDRPGRGRGRDLRRAHEPCCPSTSTARWPTCARWPASQRARTSHSSRTRARHTAPGETGSRRDGRARGSLQLLSRQEPRRDGRRRSARHVRRRSSRRRAGTTGARTAVASTSTSSRGTPPRLDTIQALVLLRKLPLLESWNEERRRAAALYLEGLAGVGDLVLPPVPSGSEPVWHLFVVRTSDPDDLAEHLPSVGIDTGRHYPVPGAPDACVRATSATREGAFPVAEELARTCSRSRSFPGITEAEIEAVVDAVGAYFDG